MPPQKNLPYRRDVTPGELYKEIAVTRVEFEGGEEKLVKKTVHQYVQFCRKVNTRFPGFGKNPKVTPDYTETISFLGWDLKDAEYVATVTFVMAVSMIFAIVVGAVLYFTVGDMVAKFAGSDFLAPLYIFGPLLAVSLYLTNYVQQYPFNAANIEKVKALTYVPEIIGYMIMSLKLVPNLEKAVEFAASHGRGKIADEFKQILWGVQIGTYNSVAEGLDVLAYRWGKYSDEFKHALMRVRASVIENTEAKRHALLDKTMSEILESVRLKMEQYARSLSQPSVVLFYLGVLLPLILIIVLPVGSAFSGTAMANPFVLGFIYNIIIPAGTLAFVWGIIASRPPTYEPPKIPDNYPGLPKKGTIIIGKGKISMRLALAIILIAGLAFSYLFSQQGFPPKFTFSSDDEARGLQLFRFDQFPESVLKTAKKPANHFADDGPRYQELLQRYSEPEAKSNLLVERQTFFLRSENDITPYNLIFGLILTFGIMTYIYFHYSAIYKRKVQEDYMQMESEFKDSLYVLASRMGENKPVEEALKHTKGFLPDMKISQTLFGKTIDNIALLGMPLEAAVFDPAFGALRDNPSAIIRTSMKLLVDSVQLGVNVAARTMISLSMQLANMEQVTKTLATLVSDVTSSMKTISVFIAPVVLGVTTILQKIVVVTIAGIAESSVTQQTVGAVGGSLGGTFTETQVTGLINPEVLGQIATPTEFTFMIALYIIEIVLIMTYFTTKIQEDNDLLVQLNLATRLPMAMLVFVVTMILSNVVVGGYVV